MQAKALGIAIVAAMLASPMHAKCQTAGGVATVITFNIQLNMTNLSPDLERVRLSCIIQSAAYTLAMPTLNTSSEATGLPGVDLYVVQGKAVGALSLQVPILAAYLTPDAVGKQANYLCMLIGYSTSLQRWNVLNEQQTNPAFRVSPAAPPMSGTFVW